MAAYHNERDLLQTTHDEEGRSETVPFQGNPPVYQRKTDFDPDWDRGFDREDWSPEYGGRGAPDVTVLCQSHGYFQSDGENNEDKEAVYGRGFDRKLIGAGRVCAYQRRLMVGTD